MHAFAEVEYGGSVSWSVMTRLTHFQPAALPWCCNVGLRASINVRLTTIEGNPCPRVARSTGVPRQSWLTRLYWRVGRPASFQGYKEVLRLSASQGIGMNRYFLYSDRVLGSVFLVHVEGFNFGQCCEALITNQVPENGVETVKMGSFVEKNKKLRAICVWPLIGHGDDTSGTVSQCGSNLVLKRNPPDRLASLGIIWRWICWPAGLCHEVFYQTVYWGLVVVTRGAESKEILVCVVSCWNVGRGRGTKPRLRPLTSAVFGTLSQNTSTLRSPKSVCSVTDIARMCQLVRANFKLL